MQYPLQRNIPLNQDWPTIVLVARFKLAIALCFIAATVLPILAQMLAMPGAAIWATIFLSATLSSVVGFAFSPIAGAILFHVDTSYLHAVQSMLVASISLQAYGVFHLRRRLNIRMLAIFLAGGVTTLPIGIYIALHTAPELLLLIIGTFLAIYGLSQLLGSSRNISVKGKLGDFIAGATGGLTGPVAAFPGPFVTIWCSLKGLDRTRQRAITRPYILIMQVLSFVSLCFLAKTGTHFDWSVMQYSLPALCGAFIGLKVFERLNEKQFLSLVGVLLTISGIAMIAKCT